MVKQKVVELFDYRIMAVRKSGDDGREFFDYESMAFCEDDSRDLVEKEERIIPGWCAANPIARYARVKLTCMD